MLEGRKLNGRENGGDKGDGRGDRLKNWERQIYSLKQSVLWIKQRFHLKDVYL